MLYRCLLFCIAFNYLSIVRIYLKEPTFIIYNRFITKNDSNTIIYSSKNETMECNALNFSTEFNTLNFFLKSFAYKLTKDKHSAEDLFQDTAFLAFKNRNKFQSGTNMKAWASTIMRNTFINKFRQKKRRSEVSGGDELLDLGDRTVLNDAEQTLAERELLKLVGSLKRKFREPFVMAFQGYRYKEIGEHLSLPVGTVKSRIFEARKLLKERIEAT